MCQYHLELECLLDIRGFSDHQDGNQLVQIFGILSYPFLSNNKVNACTTSGR